MVRDADAQKPDVDPAAGSIELDWRFGRHRFRLALGELRALQHTLNAGPNEIMLRLRQGTWRVDDIIEVVRLGLIGGGMAADDARKLVAASIETAAVPWTESATLAFHIVAIALAGVPDDPVGKGPAGPATAATAGSASPSSTATPSSGGSRRRKPTS